MGWFKVGTEVLPVIVFIFGFWIAPNRSIEAVKDIGAEFIGIVKIITKIFCKETNKNLV